MTGSPAAPRSGENTLTVSQSSGSAPGAAGDTGVSANPDCGGGGPNAAASRTPSHGPAVRTTGSVTSMRTPSPAGPGPDISGCGPLWPPGRRLRHRVEQDDGNLARRGALLVIREIRGDFLLPGVDRRPLVRVRDPRPDLERLGAHLDGGVRVRDQVAEPLRVTRPARRRAEDRKSVV